MNYLRIMFDKIKNWFRRRTFFVICDPNDNSVTLSKALFKHMDATSKGAAKVYTFFVPYGDGAGEYGFIVDPQFDCETQLADIQYNSKFKTVGFECLVPTVNRIFYDYDLTHEWPVKLSVQVCRTGELLYYKICRPNDKHLR